MPETTRAAPTRREELRVSPRNNTPISTAVSGTKKTYAATRLASPARTSPNHSTQARAVPARDTYSQLAIKVPVQEISDHGSRTSPRTVRKTPPIRNGPATDHSVETLSWTRLKYTVPSAQKRAVATPSATPRRGIVPKRLPTLTATIPEKPRNSPMSFAGESASPSMSHAIKPTSFGCG